MRPWLAGLVALSSLGCQDRAALTDFALDRDAPSFGNFGGVVAPGLLDGAAVRELFGPAACEPGSSPEAGCVPVPEAVAWTLQVNRSMAGGRCEGLAALSEAFWQGTRSPAEFGADRVSDLSLSGGPALGRELAVWQGTQRLATVGAAAEALTPEEALDRLGEAFRAGELAYTLGVVRLAADGTPEGGHSVLPYGIAARDDGAWDLLVYDPDHPSEDRRMRLDPSAEAWEAQVGDSRRDDGAFYSGDAADGNPLWLTPLSARERPDRCPFCAATPDPGASVLVDGPGRAAAGACSGGQAGFTPEGFVPEAGGFTARPAFSGLWNDAAGMSFFGPPDGDVCVTMEGRPPNPDESDRLAMGVWRPGRRVAQVRGPMGAGHHALSSTDDGASLRYDSDVATGGPLLLGAPLSDGGQLTVQVETEASPQSLGLSIDAATGDARVDLGAVVDLRIRVELSRARGERSDRFVAVLEPLPGGADITLRAGAWAGDGAPLSADVDDDGDGVIDRTLRLEDCQDVTRCPTLSGDDLDEVASEDDNCPERFNPGQEDADRDGVGDACDGCPDDATCSCLPGTWDDDGDPTTACLACDPGEFCGGGLEPPLACGDATWDADADPSTPCAPCDPGHGSLDGLSCH